MRWLVTGASGHLGGYLLRELVGRGETVVAWSGGRRGPGEGVELRPVDLCEPDAVQDAFQAARADVCVHAAALATVADCWKEPERARRVNVDATRFLTELTDRNGVRFVFVSTDLVFDGERGSYREGDATAPLSVYGRSKRDAEGLVVSTPRGAVVRVSLLFGPSLAGRATFFDQQLDALRGGRPVPLFQDEWRTPLSLLSAARGLVAVARSDVSGIVHFGGPERLTRWEMGRRLAAYVRADDSALVPTLRQDVAAPEPRPRDVSLDSARFRDLLPAVRLPAWEQALADMHVR
jgi:dTDP-4-dehydrorhamnose reductase